uniref:Uncharacterized protein n=1 Tax=Glossina pallidipes TaxID=7398 RepID=A0A1A9ZBI5_GLOPL
MEWKMTCKSVTKRRFIAHTNHYFDSSKARTGLKKANKGRFHSFEDYLLSGRKEKVEERIKKSTLTHFRRDNHKYYPVYCFISIRWSLFWQIMIPVRKDQSFSERREEEFAHFTGIVQRTKA